MKIEYQKLTFKGNARRTIDSANVIIEEYAAQGYSLTLRQLYYQFVARGLCPNKQKEYKRLSDVITNGRRAGLIDWSAIVDRTRFLRTISNWNSPADIVATCARDFKLDLWERTQNAYVEVWFEKDALLGVFENSAEARRLPLFSCRGFVSDSEIWSAAMRFVDKQNDGKECLVLHFGDHDPSGIDMTRDIRDRFQMFGATPEIRRMALNMDQVEQYNPPPNPAKITDSRFADYEKKFGDESWELDALNPDVLVALVHGAIDDVLNLERWDEDLALEDKHKRALSAVSDKWEKVAKFATRKPKPRKKK